MAYPKGNQEIYDVVMLALWNQNKQSISEVIETSCAYRRTDGVKCAIGHLIPDSLYRKYFEMNDVENLSIVIRERNNKKFIPFLNFLQENLDFLQEMQTFHDDFSVNHYYDSFRDYMKGCAPNFAEEHGLIPFKLPKTTTV